MVGIRSFPIGTKGLFSGALAVSFREGTWYVALWWLHSSHLIIPAAYHHQRGKSFVDGPPNKITSKGNWIIIPPKKYLGARIYSILKTTQFRSVLSEVTKHWAQNDFAFNPLKNIQSFITMYHTRTWFRFGYNLYSAISDHKVKALTLLICLLVSTK